MMSLLSNQVRFDKSATVSTIVSFSKGNSFTSVPFTGTGKLKIIFLIQLPSGCFSGNNSIRSMKARINSFRSTSEAASQQQAVDIIARNLFLPDAPYLALHIVNLDFNLIYFTILLVITAL